MNGIKSLLPLTLYCVSWCCYFINIIQVRGGEKNDVDPVKDTLVRKLAAGPRPPHTCIVSCILLDSAWLGLALGRL